MPLDQPGSLLSLRLVRIPQLRGDNDAHRFLSSRQGLSRRLQSGRGQPSVQCDGDVKLTKLLQKLRPYLDLPMEVARRFVEDMRAFHAEKNGVKADGIAARQLHAS